MGFEQAYAKVIGDIERGYSNNPADSGGETIWGVTERVARANGWAGPMADMPEAFAKSIYKAQYWDTLRGDDIAQVSDAIATELFEQNVNLPFAMPARFLQRLLNVLNREQRDYQDMTVDGVVGPVTVLVLKRFLELRGRDGEQVMLKGLNGLQCAFYIDLAERRSKDEAFEFGWILKRIGF